MTAKEMFEALGYKFYDHNFLNVPKSENAMITQDAPYIEYMTESADGEEIIRFYAQKVISVDAFIHRGGIFRIPAPLNMDELKAITKQCEELGWLKDDKSE